MKEIVDMAKAHLQTVENRIQELEMQKNEIEQQILRLKEYLLAGHKAVQENTTNDPGSISQQG